MAWSAYGGRWGRNELLRRRLPLCDTSGLGNKRPEELCKGLNDQFLGWSRVSQCRSLCWEHCRLLSTRGGRGGQE